jgi:hypothetical protein
MAEDVPDRMIRAAAARASRAAAAAGGEATPPPIPTIQPLRSPLEAELPSIREALAATSSQRRMAVEPFLLMLGEAELPSIREALAATSIPQGEGQGEGRETEPEPVTVPSFMHLVRPPQTEDDHE